MRSSSRFAWLIIYFTAGVLQGTFVYESKTPLSCNSSTEPQQLRGTWGFSINGFVKISGHSGLGWGSRPTDTPGCSYTPAVQVCILYGCLALSVVMWCEYYLDLDISNNSTTAWRLQGVYISEIQCQLYILSFICWKNKTGIGLRTVHVFTTAVTWLQNSGFGNHWLTSLFRTGTNVTK